MANLIVTIISLAIVAVAAIMGIYYGGVAYENGQAQAAADAIANKAKQMNAAITLYQAQTSNGFLSTLANQISTQCGMPSGSTVECSAAQKPIKSLLTPTYISDVTSGDSSSGSQLGLNWTGYDNTGGLAANDWEVSGSDNVEVLQPGATHGYFMFIIDGDAPLQSVFAVTSLGVKICQQIAIIARGNNAAPIQMPYASVYGPGMNPILDCGWQTDSGETAIGQCIGNDDCMLVISSQLTNATTF